MHAFAPTRMGQNLRVRRILVYLLRLPTKIFFASWSWVAVGPRGKATLRSFLCYPPSRIP